MDKSTFAAGVFLFGVLLVVVGAANEFGTWGGLIAGGLSLMWLASIPAPSK